MAASIDNSDRLVNTESKAKGNNRRKERSIERETPASDWHRIVPASVERARAHSATPHSAIAKSRREGVRGVGARLPAAYPNHCPGQGQYTRNVTKVRGYNFSLRH